MPATAADAAKWSPRVSTSGPLISAANQLMSVSPPSLADLEGEIAVRRMGVDRQHVPVDVIGADPARTERHRHLVAADPRLAAVDALAGGIGHRDRREGRLELLGEPQRHLLRRRRNLVADARLGMVEEGVRLCRAGRKHEQERDCSSQECVSHGYILAQFLKGLAGWTAPPNSGLPMPRGSMSSR